MRRWLYGSALTLLAGGLSAVSLQLLQVSRAEKQRHLQTVTAFLSIKEQLDSITKNLPSRKRDDLIDNFLSHFPYFSRKEVVSLTDAELSTEKINTAAVSIQIPDKLNFVRDINVTRKSAPRYQYYRNLGAPAGDLPVDSSVPRPLISVDDADSLRPLLSVPKAFGPDGQEANYYFEVDTDPSFSSPNLWRFPALQQTEFPEDPTSVSGLKFNVFRTTQRNVDGTKNRLRFPFNVTAMRLPEWRKLNFTEMQKQARALAFNVPTQNLIKEFYNYTRSNYPWSNDTVPRSPFETFVRGLGECGHVNDLMGALLEMNGIRYRNVSGFSPLVRVAYPGGGHSAIEIMNPETGQWSYVDPYLDIMLMNVSAEEVAHSKEGEGIFISSIEPRFRGFGQSVTLGKLFQYRTYYDKLNRQSAMTMANLFGEESRYGTDWPLNIAPNFNAGELFEAKKTIHVRARYIFSGSRRVQYYSDVQEPASGDAVASEWAIATFEVEPRRLISQAAIASRVPK